MTENINFINLQEVPREIIMVALNLHGKKRHQTTCAQKDIKYFKDEFYELFNPNLAERVNEEKNRLMNDFKFRVQMLIHDFDFNKKYCNDQYFSLHKQTKYWLDYYDEMLLRQKNAYELINDFMQNNKENFDSGRPIEIGQATTNLPEAYILSKGNVIRYYQHNGNVGMEEIYTDADYSDVVDGFIDYLYKLNPIQTIEAPTENE